MPGLGELSAWVPVDRRLVDRRWCHFERSQPSSGWSPRPTSASLNVRVTMATASLVSRKIVERRRVLTAHHRDGVVAAQRGWAAGGFAEMTPEMCAVISATGRRLRSSRPAISAFPEIAVGSACTSTFSELARRLLALRPAHSRRHLYVTSDTEGFSHFVTSATAPVASGWSVRRVGLAPTGKRRLVTAHANSGHCPTPGRKTQFDAKQTW